MSDVTFCDEITLWLCCAVANLVQSNSIKILIPNFLNVCGEFLKNHKMHDFVSLTNNYYTQQ